MEQKMRSQVLTVAQYAELTHLTKVGIRAGIKANRIPTVLRELIPLHAVAKEFNIDMTKLGKIPGEAIPYHSGKWLTMANTAELLGHDDTSFKIHLRDNPGIVEMVPYADKFYVTRSSVVRLLGSELYYWPTLKPLPEPEPKPTLPPEIAAQVGGIVKQVVGRALVGFAKQIDGKVYVPDSSYYKVLEEAYGLLRKFRAEAINPGTFGQAEDIDRAIDLLGDELGRVKPDSVELVRNDIFTAPSGTVVEQDAELTASPFGMALR